MNCINWVQRTVVRYHFLWYGLAVAIGTLGLSFSAQAQSCDCPAATSCGTCVGGITSFTLKFNGASTSLITASDQLGVCFSAMVNPGATFTFTGTLPNQKFVGMDVEITINGVPNAVLSVLCGTPVYAQEVYGSFLVVAGQSLNGGALCCSPTNTDAVAPQITSCPGVVNASLGASGCTVPVSWAVPNATDNCTLASFTSDHLPGDSFGLGTTAVTYLATDSQGNSSSCTFDVVVSDNTNPTITNCPTDIVLQVDALCQAIATWAAPIASDNCSVTLSASHTSGATFPLGTTPVTYTATDGSGNTTQCSFNVVVQDQGLPVFTSCPANITMTADAGCQAVASWAVPAATDNCSVTVTASHSPGAVFPIGTTTVTYTATDVSGNTSTCSFNVVVEDNTDPTLTGCPTDIVLQVNGLCQAVATWAAPLASDNCSVTLSASHTSGATFPLGTTPVTYTATDGSGNTTQCSFNVVVQDQGLPVFTSCPANITVTADAGCQAVASWAVPAATDNCSVTVTGSHSPSAVFPIGTTTVTYTATDVSGNTSTCSFNVVVEDNTDPAITNCPTDIVLQADALCQAIATWTAPIASDNCSVTLSASHTSGATFPLGTTPVTYTATDGSGNTTQCSFNVVVQDQGLPVFTSCPANITVAADAGCQAVASWAVPAATDNCSVTVTASHSPGAVFPIGTTAVTYTATDASGNTSTCSFNVTVVDQQPPVLANCPNDITVEAGNNCQATVNWAEPTATDNCTVSLTSTHASGSAFPIGTTLVTFTATDGAGNSSTCSFNVFVKDLLPPVLQNCPTDIVLQADANCGAVGSWATPTTSDNCEVTLNSDHAPGQIFPIGTTRVTYTAQDGGGNTTSCSFNVIVRDVTAPVFTSCPTNLSVVAGENCSANVVWQVPNATDACDVSITSSHRPGELFEIGSTTVTYVAEDASGNKATCTFEVEVKDGAPPQIVNFPASIELIAGSTCTAVASWSEPVFDDCSAVTVETSHNNGQTFSIGTTEVSYTFKDVNQATTVRKFNVIVKDVTPPVFKQFPADITVSTASCEATVTWVAPLAEDNCAIIIPTATATPGTVFPLGTSTVQYTATDANGNTTTLPLKISVINSVAPYWTDCPQDVELTVTTRSNAVATWEDPEAHTTCGEIITTSSHQSGDAFPVGVTVVEYQAQTTDGQTALCSFRVTVKLEEIVFDVPQLITPNGDGNHDTWLLNGLEKFTDNEVSIFDRWGGKIWGAKSYNNQQVVWDGNRDTGGSSPSGTYFFVIRVKRDAEVVDKKGFIELIR